MQENATFFLEDPQSQTAKMNSSVTFHCKANMQPTMFSSFSQLDIMWWKDGMVVQGDSRIIIVKSFGYSELKIHGVERDDMGTYQCVVNDGPVYNNTDACFAANSFSYDTKWLFVTVSLPAYLNIIGGMSTTYTQLK